jgi:hypothetical protein
MSFFLQIWEPDQNASEGGKLVSSLASNNNERAPSIDLSLASAVKRHVRVVYEQSKSKTNVVRQNCSVFLVRPWRAISDAWPKSRALLV